MQIQSLNLLQFQNKANTSFTRKKDIVPLPNPNNYNYMPLETTLEKQKKLNTGYESALKTAFFDKNGELSEDIKDYLDNAIFEFRTPAGPQYMTIKEKINDSIVREADIDSEMYHATWTTDTIEEIKKDGFKPEFIKRTKFGPGFYFSPNQAGAMDYGSAILKARCKGRCVYMKSAYYDKMNDSDIAPRLKEYLGLNSKGYPTANIETQTATRVLNEYCRSYLSDELGYDFAYGADRSGGAFVAHNPKAITDIDLYKF